MTALAAQRVGVAHRRVLAPGMYAGVVLFDPTPIVDRATFVRSGSRRECVRCS
jgi:N-acyl-D-aspartate/D-glutamate deacylase